MDILVDNNVLSSLSKIDRLQLLDQVFDNASTIPSVLDELHHGELSSNRFVKRINAVKTYNGGWLNVYAPTEQELALAESIGDHALSRTDAKCIAVAEMRSEPLLTDDSHVGTICTQRGTSVWDLKLFLEACIQREYITGTELEALISDLEQKDGYRFSERDRNDLFDRFTDQPDQI